MKNLIIVIITLSSVINNTTAQGYRLYFSGTGSSLNVDSVNVMNLSSCENITVAGEDTIILGSETGTENADFQNILQVFPNPCTGDVKIGQICSPGKSVRISIYSMTGIKLFSEKIVIQDSDNFLKLKGLGCGVYIVKIETDEKQYTRKIISNNSCLTTNSISVSTIDGSDNLRQAVTSKNKGEVHIPYSLGEVLLLTAFSEGIYATVKTILPLQNGEVVFEFVPCEDADGNNYPVVKIGTATWMAKNLNTTHFNNGDSIPDVTDGVEWTELKKGAFCNYNNSITYGDVYGKLYNWYATDDQRNICPAGWRIPSSYDWYLLQEALGDSCAANLRERCSWLWLSDSCFNESGFSALPGGNRGDFGGNFSYIKNVALFWEADSINGAPSISGARGIGQFNETVVWLGYSFYYGLSVRCVKD